MGKGGGNNKFLINLYTMLKYLLLVFCSVLCRTCVNPTYFRSNLYTACDHTNPISCQDTGPPSINSV